MDQNPYAGPNVYWFPQYFDENGKRLGNATYQISDGNTPFFPRTLATNRDNSTNPPPPANGGTNNLYTDIAPESDLPNENNDNTNNSVIVPPPNIYGNMGKSNVNMGQQPTYAKLNFNRSRTETDPNTYIDSTTRHLYHTVQPDNGSGLNGYSNNTSHIESTSELRKLD